MEETIYSKNYRYPHQFRENIKEEINKILGWKIIGPRNFSYNLPVWIVPKKADAPGRKNVVGNWTEKQSPKSILFPTYKASTGRALSLQTTESHSTGGTTLMTGTEIHRSVFVNCLSALRIHKVSCTLSHIKALVTRFSSLHWALATWNLRLYRLL